uniref:hypothetical protein n=1 Tax=Candidatus Enterovibrio escicola TaxID=1927127 RepID=UPI001CC2D693
GGIGMHKRALLLSSLLLIGATGCTHDESADQTQKILVQMNDMLNKQQLSLNKMSLDDESRVANALASSSKLSSMAAYLMMESNTGSLTEDIQKKILFASRELSDDQLQKRMYNALVANGLPASYSVDSSQAGIKKYVVRGRWHLEAKSGSAFYIKYPVDAIEMLPYERIYYPEGLCEEGYNPFVIHSLLKRSKDIPTIEADIVELRNGLQILLRGVDFYEGVKNYRVLVDVRCKESDGLPNESAS